VFSPVQQDIRSQHAHDAMRAIPGKIIDRDLDSHIH